MPITNLNGVHFTQAEKDDISSHWKSIRQILETKNVNLSPEEREKFGSVSEQNKLVVQKVLDYSINQTHLQCPEVDYAETSADWEDRKFLAGFITDLEEAMVISNNIRITHDFDAYQAARTDYNYTKYRMDTDGGAGWETKYNDLLPFFRTNDGSSSQPAPQPATPAS